MNATTAGVTRRPTSSPTNKRRWSGGDLAPVVLRDKMRALRVLHFAETLVGGPATYLNELLPFQVSTYDQVSLFCPANQSHLIRCDGVSVTGFSDYTRSLGGVVRLFRHWRSFLRENEFDVVHLHSSFAGMIGRVGLDDGYKAQVIYCPHGWSFGMDCNPLLQWVYARAECLLSERSDAIINISHSERFIAEKAGLPISKLRTVHSGIRDSEWRTLPKRHVPRKLLFVGRYDRQKGIDLLIEAMQELHSDGFSLDCLGAPVIGKPSVTKFPSYVADHGWQTPGRVGAAIAAADIVVVPSRWEGFGLVAAEAMRAARPVVAAAVGGLAELVVDGETGVLHQPRSTEAIVEAVRRIRTMDVRQLGINARSRFESKFIAKRMLDGIDHTYREAVA